MALKFLNKKGWHTGSLRNIENVWKAEQKHDAEQKKLDELRKQIQEERERSEFRILQEQAGFVPKQERLDFLYDSGLAVGKGSSDGFKALEAPPKVEADATTSKQESVPGALFEDKPQSANDAWRKLHSDPLLLIRQQEQEARARIKNNPVQMAMIRRSVEAKKHEKKGQKKHHKKSKHERHSSEAQTDSEGDHNKKHHKKSKHERNRPEVREDSEGPMNGAEDRRKRSHRAEVRIDSEGDYSNKHRSKSKHYRNQREALEDSGGPMNRGEDQRKRSHQECEHPLSNSNDRSENDHLRASRGAHQKIHQTAPKLSAEEKAARAREMQLDAELHEEQRWKRLNKASEADAREVGHASSSRGRSFLDAAQKSVYGTEQGGRSTIEESVRRRTYYLQGRSEREGNAFRR